MNGFWHIVIFYNTNKKNYDETEREEWEREEERERDKENDTKKKS